MWYQFTGKKKEKRKNLERDWSDTTVDRALALNLSLIPSIPMVSKFSKCDP